MSANPLRVAQILAGAEFGGAENFYVRLVSSLNERPQLIQKAYLRGYPDRRARLEAAGVAYEEFAFGGPLQWFARARYLRALKDFAPDIVMTWMGRATQHTPRGDYVLINRLGHYYKLKYYRHADYWVGISKGICDHLIRGGMPAQRVEYIPNFADETPVTALPRTSFDTPAGVPLLVSAGRLHTNKAFDVLLKSLALLPDAYLWLAGSGPEEQALKALAAELGVSERVRFLGWRNDVTTLMASADVFVCPSRHEGLGSIVMEAWAHRCPIVATLSQGPGELIEDGVTGLTTPIDDHRALAAALETVLADTALAQRLRDNAEAHYKKHFARQVITDQYCAFYQQCLDQR